MKEKIIKLKEEGKTYKEICEILGISKSNISYYIGSKRRNLKERKPCKNCDKEIPGAKTFCNKECQKEYKNKIRIDKLESGKILSNFSIRKALIDLNGANCSICNITNNWNNKPLTLHVDHIDGDSDNNNFENLRLVCPNCHSQLETSKHIHGIKKETKRNKYLRKIKGYQLSS